MKNIAIFICFVIMLFASVINPVYCEEHSKRYAFSIEPHFGIVYGQSFEAVYPTPGYHKAELLSELIWDMKPVFYAAFKLDFGRRDPMSAPGFYSSLNFKIGFPSDSGIMEDRDWKSKENNALTNFSSHTNKTRSFYWADIIIGASIPVKSYFHIKPFFSGSWMHFAFTGRDGYYIYARDAGSGSYYPIDDNPNYAELSGDVIRYQQDWIIAALGFSAGADITSFFSIDFLFQISPFAYCFAKDDHLKTGYIFQDYTIFGLFLEPKLKLSYLLDNLSFSLEAAYRYIGLTRGPSFNKKVNDSFFYKDGEAGAGLSLFDLSLRVKYSF